MTKARKYQRKNDRMIVVDTVEYLAIVDYADILASCEIIPDDRGEAPWDYDEGFEHHLVRCRQFDWPDCTDRKTPGFYGDREDCLHADGYWQRIIIDDRILDKWGFPELKPGQHTPNGMSKQVYAEYRQTIKRNAIRTIRNWYVNGWSVSGIVCKYNGFEDSCWGFYDLESDDSYRESCIREIAGNVATQLIDVGFTVNGFEPYDSRKVNIDGFRWRLRDNLRPRIERR